ncbi:50S ribosomal protein L25 [Clostridium oceanicum]|uniref:Large ribosomal subunit protein bL25 n=1 Tax=Clostridium oceanicum TaxID=1543 RepID=A0ABN1JX08_9CLOT
MNKNIINGLIRNEKSKKCRRDGFVPGVLYGVDVEKTMSVKFDKTELIRCFKKYGMNSGLWVKIQDKKEYVLLKEVQRDIVTGHIIHVDMQAVSKDEVIKHNIPLFFTGKEELEHNGFLLETFASEIKVSGKVKYLPESINIDVSHMNPGNRINVSDIKVDDNVKICNDIDENLASISDSKNLNNDLEDEVV